MGLDILSNDMRIKHLHITKKHTKKNNKNLEKERNRLWKSCSGGGCTPPPHHEGGGVYIIVYNIKQYINY